MKNANGKRGRTGLWMSRRRHPTGRIRLCLHFAFCILHYVVSALHLVNCNSAAARSPRMASRSSRALSSTFEKAALLSKKALFRELGSANPDPTLDTLEKELLARANRLGIGPQGYGGDTTSFGIHMLTYPCHITSLPVAVTIECHAHRHKEVTL